MPPTDPPEPGVPASDAPVLAATPPKLPGRIKSMPDPVPRGELTRMVMEEHMAVDVARLQQEIRAGTHWFYWVAALSLVNSLIAIFGGGVTFLAGLAVSQILDGIAVAMGNFGPYFAIGIDLVLAFFICGIGYLASHGSRAVLIVGMILYALDGVIFVLFSAFLPAAFHAYVLYRMWAGWLARRKLDQLRAESPAAAALDAHTYDGVT